MPNLVIMDNQLLRKLSVLRLDWQTQDQLAFLYQNDRVPQPTDNTTNYTPCTYDGASGQSVRWTDLPVIAGPGEAYMRGEPLIFQPTGTTIASQVYGYFVVSVTQAGLVIYAQRFDGAPFVIGNTTDPITVLPEWRERSIPTP